MPVIVGNNVSTVLGAGCTAAATSITLLSGSGASFPAIPAGSWAYATLTNTSNAREIVKITAIAGDVLTVVRGVDGTTGLAWNLGDTIEMRGNAGVWNDKLDKDTATASYGALSGKNRIINGSCALVQRTSGTFTAAAGTLSAGYAGPDRYLAGTSAGGSLTQSAGTIAYNGVTYPSVLQTVNSVMTDSSTNKYWLGISHTIEGFNCYDLIGQQIAVSFIFKASVTGTYALALRDGANAYSYVTTFSATAGVAQKYTFVIPAIPAGASLPVSNAAGIQIYIGAINSGTYATATLGSWQNANYITASGVTNWGLTSGATIAATNIQLEAGSVATPFEVRSIAHEFMLCQRYYQTVGVFTGSTTIPSGQTQGGRVFFPVPMRVSPTISNIVNNNTGGGTLTLSNQSVGGLGYSMLSTYSGTDNGFSFTCNVSAEF